MDTQATAGRQPIVIMRNVIGTRTPERRLLRREFRRGSGDNGRGKRIFRVGGMRIVPGRAYPVNLTYVSNNMKELEALDRKGLVVFEYEDQQMPLDSAVRVLNGEQLTGPLFERSYVMDPSPRSGKGSAEKVRKPRTRAEVWYNHFQMLDLDDETYLGDDSLEPELDEPRPEANVSLDGLDLVINFTPEPEKTATVSSTSKVKAPVDAGEWMTLGEAAIFSGLNQGWLYSQVESNALEHKTGTDEVLLVSVPALRKLCAQVS